MRLAWLLLTRSGRSNWNRLGLTAAAVALGMVMLLVFMAGLKSLDARTAHSSWQYELFVSNKEAVTPINGVAPLKAKSGLAGNLNKWRNEDIATVSLRPTGANSPHIPELPTPKEGEYYVSQALADVMGAHPEARIGERFGNKQIGIIPEARSMSPDALEVIRGMSAEEAEAGNVVNVYKIADSGEIVSRFSGILGVVLLFGATILLLPIVTFISIATQLGSAQREKRYAALRLIGATRKQVSHIIAVESLSAAVIGIVAGTLIYIAVLPLMAEYRFDGMRFWQSDITVPIPWYLLAVGLTLLFCLVANWWGMRHVHMSPLGVAQSGKIGKRPRTWRLVLLVPGIVLFIWLSLPGGAIWIRENVASSVWPLLLLIGGTMSIMFGLLLAGPWLTRNISQLAARRTHKATSLLATKRIAAQSQRIFRSVSGVVLALFAGSFYLTGVSGIDTLNATALSNNGYSQLKPDIALVSSKALPEEFAKELEKQLYVKLVTPIDSLEDGTNLIPCSALVTYTKHTCPKNTDGKVLLNFNAPVAQSVSPVHSTAPATGQDYLVLPDSNNNLDKLRTFVAQKTGIDTPAQTHVISGTYAQVPILSPIIAELASLTYAGMAVTLLVAIASLIVSAIGGLLERKRSFVTLRLGGMTVKQMERTVMVESLIPLISVALLAAGLGVWVGWVFINAMSRSVEPVLTPLYFGIVIGSLLVAIFAIRTVVPMLGKITRPEENQTE